MLRHLKRARTNYHYTAWIRAFGEEKTAHDWALDPRCVHHDSTLVSGRVRQGVPAETAITTPRNYRAARSDEENPEGSPNQEFYEALARTLTAHGETKPIGEWLEDDRCEWDSAMVVGKRLDSGFPGEMALRLLPKLSGRLYDAFGEVKTIAEWTQDSRCLYSPLEVRRRLARGMTIEQALSQPLGFVDSPKSRRYRTLGDLYAGFGESKSIRDWACDARCQVNVDILRRRISDGWPIERAVSTPFIDSINEVR